MSDEPRLLTVLEASQKLRISRTHCYDLIRDGELKALRLGGKILIPRATIDRMIAEATAA